MPGVSIGKSMTSLCASMSMFRCVWGVGIVWCRVDCCGAVCYSSPRVRSAIPFGVSAL